MQQGVELERLRDDWDRAARDDAFFNIMTIHGMTEEQFWQSGCDEIDALVAGLDLSATHRALDFGCGVGRLTQALGYHFDMVDGVDISPEMIRLADRYNRHGDRCWYSLNPANSLEAFPDDVFDLVYSTIVLQHMHPHLAEAYVKEFIRVGREHVVFQLPVGDSNQRHGSGALTMYGAPESTVREWVGDNVRSVEVSENDAAGSGFTSHQYRVIL